jgi:outer membrane protein assembly factor BamB
MKTSWMILAVLLSTVSVSADEAAWPQLHGGSSHDNWRELEDRIRWPKVRWHVTGASGQPSIGHGALYSGGHRLLRIDPDRGAVLSAWTPTEEDGFVLGGVALAEKRVVARLFRGAVVALDHDLGRVLWRRPATGGRHARFYPGAMARGLYVVGDGACVLALRIKDGSIAWRRSLAVREAVELTPAIHGGRVFLGTTHGRVMALDLGTGKVAWRRRVGTQVKWTDPVVTRGRVVIPDRSGGLHALDLETGERIWRGSFQGVGFSVGVGRDALIGGFSDRVTLMIRRRGSNSSLPGS